MEALATRLLGSHLMAGDVERWFDQKRMERYLKEEEERQALADPSGAKYAEHVILRLMSMAASKVPGLASPFGRDDYVKLLGDARVDVNCNSTSTKVLKDRVFSNRQHIANMLQLSLGEIERVPSAAEHASSRDDDPLACSVCAQADASDDNPILKCDGWHDVEVGIHMRCLPEELRLAHVPEGDWFCPTCREKGIWQAEKLLDKRTKKVGDRSLVHFLVRWAGYGSEDDTWEPLANLASGAKKMVNAFNARLRVAVAGGSAPAAAAP